MGRGFSFRKTVHEGTTVGTVLNELHLPKEMNKTIIINSIPASSEQTPSTRVMLSAYFHLSPVVDITRQSNIQLA